MAVVYQHRRADNNQIFYVGIGVKKSRSTSKRSRNPHWHNIVNSVGHSIEIVLEDITYAKAKEIEKGLIAMYGRSDLGLGKLVNMTEGGDGAVGRIMPQEEKDNLSRIGKTRDLTKFLEGRAKYVKPPLTQDQKDKLRAANLGRKMTQEQKDHLSSVNKGVKKPDGFGATLSAARKGMKFSEEHRATLSRIRKGVPTGRRTHSKTVYQYNLDGTFVAEHSSRKDASDSVTVSAQAIYHCIKGNTKQSGGFKWSYIKLH